jgi:aldehyde dehydrogenase (NAD+)
MNSFLTSEEIQSRFNAQRHHFKAGKTLDLHSRIAVLKDMKKWIQHYESEILEALRKDLGKSNFEGYATEIGFVLDELGQAIRNTKDWARRERVGGILLNFPSANYIYKEPYGTVLIISPWNYPFQLLFAPAIGAIAAGNTAVLKPSELAPHTAALVNRMVTDHFDPNVLTVVEGAVPETQTLTSLPFDYIFFTGSTPVGKIIMKAAAEHLTPVTLELGGKSPCIVDSSVNLSVTARRIVWGKFVNAGQTCIAPDYILVEKDFKPKLIEALRREIKSFYGDNPKGSEDYGSIINERHFDRLVSLIPDDRRNHVKMNKDDLYIEPLILDDISWDDAVMKEEIFGPILPILTYSDTDDAIAQIKSNDKPLALYHFTKNSTFKEKVLREVSFGGGCINDTIMHIANPNMPFGGVGASGMGAYHGKSTFDVFSHRKSVLMKPFALDIPLRYPPYGNKLKWVKKILN